MEQIGRYRIVGELGRGAMGIVYHAVDPAIGRSVAIKTIRIRDIADTSHRGKLRERLFTEARSAGVLSHPNIVTIYDMDEVDDLAYIAMAYVNGPTLEKILSSEDPLSGANMLRILRQTAQALDYAHGKGIVHRDVKPANIMTDEDASVKITDFGIAKITAQGSHNETRTVSGTPNYMSPEQVQGLAIDGRSDQFSLAVVAYEILTGERPFTGETLSTIVYKIVHDDPPPAHRLNGTLTERIDEVLRKALSKDPAQRFPTCSNFVGALDLACAESRGWRTLPAGAAAAMPTIAVDMAMHKPEPVAPVQPPAPEPQRQSRMLPFLLSALVVGGIAAVVAYQTGIMGGGQNPIDTPREQTAAGAEPAPQQTPEEPNKPEAKPEPEPVAPSATPVAERAVNERVLIPEPAGTASRNQDIWVTSNPPGARATLDGNPAASCLTPCMLHGASGVRRITLSQAGYLTEHREVRVGNTAIDAPLVTLRKPSGTLMLTSSPAGASIRVDGEALPQTTPAQLTLSPGAHTVTVEKNGESRTEKVQVGDGMQFLSLPLQ